MGKFAAGVVDTGGNLPLVSMVPVAKFAAGVIDTDTDIVHLHLRISLRLNS